MNNLRPIVTFLLVVVVPLVVVTIALRDAQPGPGQLDDLRREVSRPLASGVDHGKLPILQQDFTNPHMITAACLSCHTERGNEVMQSAHWNWEREAFIPGRGVTYLGKKNLTNNFCISINSNEGSCNRCHAGYGWSDKNFDFKNPYNIDCIVCHDNTGTYEKAKGGAGYPASGPRKPDYKKILASVGKPTRNNCGYCHFHGGGGNNVKHGDLEMALLTADRTVDVHMGTDGLDMQCTACHTADNHKMLGRYYGVSSSNTQRATCEQCHTATPHASDIVNEHTLKVACQTCHIPVYAKVNATKMEWDWSTATRLKGGKPYEIKDSLGNDTYLSIKGDFVWKRMVEPEYVWFNGTADHHLLSDKIDTTRLPLKINTLMGEYRDANSKIHPVKIHRGKQPYDKVHLTLIQPKLWDADTGRGALWLDFDWQKALQTGMDNLGMPYSGQYGFVRSEMYLPVNHMVSLAENSLKCRDCHTRKDGRLAGLTDFYMPGRDYHAGIDTFGRLLIILSFLGVAAHGTARYLTYRKRTKN